MHPSPSEGGAPSQQQRPQPYVPQASLYAGSPTLSEEGGGGSPVKATTLATRFYAQAAAAQAAVTAAAAAALTGTGGSSSGGGTTAATSVLQRGGAGSAPLLPHLQHSSIYCSEAGSGMHRSASSGASKLRAGLQHGAPHAAGSHTSLLHLHHGGGADLAVEHYVPTGGVRGDTFLPCTFNLSKVIMGAGMMAIPRAFMLLGLLPGCSLMVLMGGLTFFTLAALISASSECVGAGGSYGALVRATLGRRAEALLQAAVLMNCYVMNVVFVVVLGDILVGSAPEFGGLLPEWSGASPADCVWLRRDVVLGAVGMAVLLPLAAMRSMERLAVVNIIGVACNGVFAGHMMVLAASAAAKGQLQALPLMPDWEELGTTPLQAAVSIATVVPVLLNCDVCHQSLHPLMPLLQPYSVARMQRLVALALTICNTLYVAVTICSGLVFGSALQPDVLSNISSAAMAPLIGAPAAQAMAAVVRVGYLLSLVGSFVLLCFPLRQCLGDLMLPGGQAAVHQHWLLLTALLVASCAAIGCYLPSIWGALALVGATASCVQAFIIPALVVLSVERAPPKAAAAAAAADSAWTQAQEDGGVLTPLLAADSEAQPGVAGGAAGAEQEQEARLLSTPPGAPANGSAAAAAAAGGRVGVRTQQAWRRVLRQAAAILCLLLGVGLFVNSVLDTLWDAVHPHAEGAGLMGAYRHLLAPPGLAAASPARP